MTRQRLTAGKLIPLLDSLCLACVLTACAEPARSPQSAAPKTEPSREQVFTLGDIDPDTPTRRIGRLQPLADYVASRMGRVGIVAGEVKIATSIEEMAALLRDGAVDYYVDSPFPTLRVRELSGSRLFLRRWVLGQPEYRSALVTGRNSDIRSLADLEGKVVAMQERYSTSGFLLPAIELVEQGFALREVSASIATAIRPGEIGYIFTRDEENTVEMLIEGSVAAGVLSNQILEQELPAEVRQSLVVVHWTPWITRALVSVRSDLDPVLADELRAILLGIDAETSARLEAIGGEGAWSWKFDELSDDQRRLLERLESKIALAAGG